MLDKAVNQLAAIAEGCLISEAVPDADGEAANLVDAVALVAESIAMVARALQGIEASLVRMEKE